MNTSSIQIARLAFVRDALDVARAHNLLTEAVDRADFVAALERGDLDRAEAWARIVIYDLSLRCQSFDLPALGRLVGALAEIDAVTP